MKMFPVALFLAVFGFSFNGFAQVDKYNLAGRYRVMQNIECLNGGKPENSPACLVESTGPVPVRGELLISQPVGQNFLRFEEHMPYSRSIFDLVERDVTDALGSRWVQRVNRVDENGFSYTQESLQKFADVSVYRREDHEILRDGDKWYYMHTLQGETGQFKYNYFRKFLIEKH